MNKSFLRKILSLLLCAALVLTLLPATALADETAGDFVVGGDSAGYSFSGGVLTFNAPGNYTVAMLTPGATTAANRIAVTASGTVNITLSGVKINLTGTQGAFDIASGSTVNLTLAAGTSNELKSGTGKAGIRVPVGAALAISGTGTLKANGGDRAAGIGGNREESAGSIAIAGGIVEATGGPGDDIEGGGAGIGGGQSGDGGAVSIGGGTVTARGGYYSAGIGGGEGFYGNGNGGAVTITDGSVKALKGPGSGFQENIGNGDSAFDSGTLTNGAGQNVFLTTVTLKQTADAPSGIGAAEIQSLTTNPALPYGTDGMYTDSGGKLYLYLPTNTLTTAAQATDGGGTPATYTGEVKTQNHHGGAGALCLPPAAPVITIQTHPANITVTAGSITESLTVAASVAPSGTPSYQWYQCDDVDKTNPGKLTGKTSASFALPTGLAAGTAHYYFCRVSVTGAEDVDSNVATVTVQAPETGDFVVGGGVLGTDFIFISGVLTFTQPGAYTVSMKAGATIPTTNRIAVAASGTVDITLSGVKIDLTGISGACAFDIASGSAVSLTLAEASNEFKSGSGGMAGIRVPVGASLAISGSGTLKVWGGASSTTIPGGAGIGGNRGESAGSIAIAGGIVEATGGLGNDSTGGSAGIGGGKAGNGGAVSISGGTVTARGGIWAAGIGGGEGFDGGGDGGAVTITGGSVKALKGPNGSVDGSQEDIGNGDGAFDSGTLTNGAGQNVLLTTVTLKQTDDSSSGIGVARIQSLTTSPALAYGTDGMYTDSSGKLYLYLPAGTLTTAAQTTDGEGTPATYTGEVDTQNDHNGAGALYLSAETSDFVVEGGDPATDYIFIGGALRFNKPGTYTVSMKEGFPENKFTGDRIVVNAPTSTEGNPVNITLNGVRIDTLASAPARPAFDVAPDSHASLTLAADTSNEFKSGADKAGIHVPTGASLTIDAQEPGTGALTAWGGGGAAGIGGDTGGDGGTIVINNGIVTAYGGNRAAGIGGGSGSSSDTGGDGGTIVINNGVVKAYAGANGAGIGGGGWGGNGGSVTINGGAVEAVGAGDGAGIGGGSNYDSTGNGGTVRITGGAVKATGGSGSGTSPGGAGIGGGGFDGSGSDVTISGGIVTATGGSNASGIGGGKDSPGGTVYISGGSVKATGNNGAEDIGHGLEDDKEHLNSGVLRNKPASAGGVRVYLTTVTLADVSEVTRVSAVTTSLTPAYGAGDMYTDKDGKLYLYLPAYTQTTAATTETGDPPEQTAYTAPGRPITTLDNHNAIGTLYEAVAVSFISATADGAAGTTTSTKIDLVFSEVIVGLTADNITITNGTGSAIKGALIGSGAVWSIMLESVVTEGTVSVAVSEPAGYIIAGSPQTATVYKAALPPTHTITATAGTGGSITPSGAVTVNEGDGQTFTITANAGYSIESVKVDGTDRGAISSFSFTNVTADHTIDVTFSRITHTITATAGTGGSITPSGAVSVNGGDGQLFTIEPDEHYRIETVTVDGHEVGAVSGYMFSNVTADHTIDVTFSRITHTITATAGTGGSITPSGAVSVNEGDGQLFTIEPDEHYRIEAVTVDGHEVGAVSGYTFADVTADHTIDVTFSRITHTITATAGTGGSITPSGTVTVNEGEGQTFTITANAGYAIESVKVDGTDQGAISSFSFTNVIADHTIDVTFSRITHTITATAGTGGSVTPSGTVTVNEGDGQTFTITANAGYAIESVKVDGTDRGAISSFSFTNVTADHTIDVTFSRITHTITATAGTGGSITPSGAVTVNEGEDQLFTIEPDEHYRIEMITVDGHEVGAVSGYTFSNVIADHTIDVTFSRITHTITATAGTGGSITPSGAVPVNEGDGQTFTITANAGYRISSVTVDGAEVGAVGAYAFYGVAANHTISATFSRIGSNDMPRVLSDPATGVSIAGYMSDDAALSVRSMTLHPEGTCAACDAIRARMADDGLLLLFGRDISLSGRYDTPLTVSIPVGAAYDGKTVTMLHCADGRLETFTATVKDGVARFTVNSLSPFAVFAKNPSVNIPRTGDTGGGPAGFVMLALAACAIILGRRRRPRAPKRP